MEDTNIFLNECKILKEQGTSGDGYNILTKLGKACDIINRLQGYIQNWSEYIEKLRFEILALNTQVKEQMNWKKEALAEAADLRLQLRSEKCLGTQKDKQIGELNQAKRRLENDIILLHQQRYKKDKALIYAVRFLDPETCDRDFVKLALKEGH